MDATPVSARCKSQCAQDQAINHITDDIAYGSDKQGNAPDDLVTKIMTTAYPETGETFGTEEKADQVTICFFKGHETSASALAWALYLMVRFPEWQLKAANEAQILTSGLFWLISKLRILRDVFRETL
jgi:cytochrome P450